MPEILRARPGLRHGLVVSSDLLVAAIAFVAAYTVAYGYPEVLAVPAPLDKIAGFLISATVAFLVFGPYRGAWRYVSTPDLLAISKGALGAVVIYTMASFLLERGQYVPRSAPILTMIFLVMGMMGTRVSYRLAIEKMGQLATRNEPGVARKRRVLLCGVSDKADSFIRSTLRDSGRHFEVVGMIDDFSSNAGRTVQGVKVLGTLDDLERIAARYEHRGLKIDEIIITELEPGKERIAHILERGNALKMKVLRISEPTSVVNLTSQQQLLPRPIEIEDLLDRPQIKPDLAEVTRLLEGSVVLATGAGGSIGSELSRQIAAFGPRRLIITDSSEYLLQQLELELRDSFPALDLEARIVDVRDRKRVMRVFSEFRPEIVVHAAALKHVPVVEANPLEGIKTNLLGTRNVADAAVANKTAAFILLSTDKAINPGSIMGATKRAAEAYCQALDIAAPGTHFATLRFGNVLGSLGSVVPRFRQQIAAGGPVAVTHPDMVRYFMSIPESVVLILHASAQALARPSDRGKIIVLDMGKPVRIVDLAERMIQLAGYRPRADIDIVFTGMRPGEKLYEELFDSSEIQDGRTDQGYVLAAPRIADHKLIHRSLDELQSCLEIEDVDGAIRLLAHLVPEYRRHRPDEVAEVGGDFPEVQTVARPTAEILSAPAGKKTS